MLSLALLITIILSMALGIAFGYAAVTMLLRSFGHRQAAPRAATTLAPSGSALAGD